jgi:phage virion morphogenesis protein
MIHLEMQIIGLPALERKLRGLSEALDTRAILDEGAAVLFNRMRTRFIQEVDPEGTPWPQSQAAARRKEKGVIGGTLYESGRLFRSLELFAPDATSRAIGTNAQSASGFPYPKMHQFGLGGQERRQFLGFGQEDVQTMLDVILRRVVEGLSK